MELLHFVKMFIDLLLKECLSNVVLTLNECREHTAVKHVKFHQSGGV